MRRTINNLISVIYSFCRFLFIKLLKWNRFKFYFIERVSPNVVVEIRKGGYLNLGKKVRVHSGTKIKVSRNGECVIEDNVKINYNCIIACHKNIKIGKGTEFGPSVYIYDHDHKYNKKTGVNSNEFKVAPVIIGQNVWIGAQSVILRGSIIGDNCVIGAGSVVKGNIPSGTVFIQKREIEIR